MLPIEPPTPYYPEQPPRVLTSLTITPPMSPTQPVVTVNMMMTSIQPPSKPLLAATTHTQSKPVTGVGSAAAGEPSQLPSHQLFAPVTSAVARLVGSLPLPLPSSDEPNPPPPSTPTVSEKSFIQRSATDMRDWCTLLNEHVAASVSTSSHQQQQTQAESESAPFARSNQSHHPFHFYPLASPSDFMHGPVHASSSTDSSSDFLPQSQPSDPVVSQETRMHWSELELLRAKAKLDLHQVASQGRREAEEEDANFEAESFTDSQDQELQRAEAEVHFGVRPNEPLGQRAAVARKRMIVVKQAALRERRQLMHQPHPHTLSPALSNRMEPPAQQVIKATITLRTPSINIPSRKRKHIELDYDEPEYRYEDDDEDMYEEEEGEEDEEGSDRDDDNEEEYEDGDDEVDDEDVESQPSDAQMDGTDRDGITPNEKRTRVGPKYQPILPELLTPNQRSVDADPCPSEEMFSPLPTVTSFACPPTPLTHPSSRGRQTTRDRLLNHEEHLPHDAADSGQEPSAITVPSEVEPPPDGKMHSSPELSSHDHDSQPHLSQDSHPSQEKAPISTPHSLVTTPNSMVSLNQTPTNHRPPSSPLLQNPATPSPQLSVIELAPPPALTHAITATAPSTSTFCPLKYTEEDLQRKLAELKKQHQRELTQLKQQLRANVAIHGKVCSCQMNEEETTVTNPADAERPTKRVRMNAPSPPPDTPAQMVTQPPIPPISASSSFSLPTTQPTAILPPGEIPVVATSPTISLPFSKPKPLTHPPQEAHHPFPIHHAIVSSPDPTAPTLRPSPSPTLLSIMNHKPSPRPIDSIGLTEPVQTMQQPNTLPTNEFDSSMVSPMTQCRRADIHASPHVELLRETQWMEEEMKTIEQDTSSTYHHHDASLTGSAPPSLLPLPAPAMIQSSNSLSHSAVSMTRGGMSRTIPSVGVPNSPMTQPSTVPTPSFRSTLGPFTIPSSMPCSKRVAASPVTPPTSPPPSPRPSPPPEQIPASDDSDDSSATSLYSFDLDLLRRERIKHNALQRAYASMAQTTATKK